MARMADEYERSAGEPDIRRRSGQNGCMERRSVVVTGYGVVSGAGVGEDSFWKGLQSFPGEGPHEIDGWDPEPWIPKKESRRLDRFTQFGVVATEDALGMAGGLGAYDPDRVTVSIATGVGGLKSLEDLILNTYSDEPTRLSPLWIPMMMAFGGMLGLASLPLPGVEAGIAVSAIVLGAMVMAEVRPPLWLAVLIVAFFAVFHGHAHGTELQPGQNALLYSLGFVIATGLLHAAGIAVGLIHRWTLGRKLLRIAGALVMVSGFYFLWNAVS